MKGLNREISGVVNIKTISIVILAAILLVFVGLAAAVGGNPLKEVTYVQADAEVTLGVGFNEYDGKVTNMEHAPVQGRAYEEALGFWGDLTSAEVSLTVELYADGQNIAVSTQGSEISVITDQGSKTFSYQLGPIPAEASEYTIEYTLTVEGRTTDTGSVSGSLPG